MSRRPEAMVNAGKGLLTGPERQRRAAEPVAGAPGLSRRLFVPISHPNVIPWLTTGTRAFRLDLGDGLGK
jgi:hypothetical protein